MVHHTTKKENNIWVKQTSDYINYRFINYKYNDEQDDDDAYKSKTDRRVSLFGSYKKLIYFN